LNTIKLASLLKGGASTIAETIGKSLAIALPPIMQEEFLKTISQPGDELMEIELDIDLKKKLPSASLVQRYQLALDLAIMELTKERYRKLPKTIKFGLADSSPIAGYDWIWSMYYEIRNDKVIEVWKAVMCLTRAIEAYVAELHRNHGGELGPDETFTMEELAYVSPDWEGWLRTIAGNIHLHINPPTALANGHQGLADKVAAESYKYHLQVPDEMPLREVADTFRSNTADMGIELSLSTFNVPKGDPQQLLPGWVERGQMPDDVEVASASDDGADAGRLDGGLDDGFLDMDVENGEDEPEPPVAPEPAELPNANSSEFQRNSYTFAGLQHMTDNANADSNKSMSHFVAQQKELKQVEAILSEGYRRQRYQWTCLRKSRFSHYHDKFDKFSGSLYEHRWHEVVSFLKKSLPLMNIMAMSFCAKRYLSGLDSAGEAIPETAMTRARQEQARGRTAFDPKRLQSSLQSGFFHGYNNMIFYVDSLPTHLAKSMELCPCHRALFEALNAYQIQAVLTAHYGGIFKTCPMNGKNIPEMVIHPALWHSVECQIVSPRSWIHYLMNYIYI
jgi:hypothetical protein